jgi:hypothetical protein
MQNKTPHRTKMSERRAAGRKRQHPPRPEASLISECLTQWSTLENYRLQEESLGLLFRDFCPLNERIEHVLLKVSALNDFYSTNIYDTYSVAKHILDQNVDARLEATDLTLVNSIARVSLKGKVKNFYSFASKYSSHHKPKDYPIFDFYVERMMLHYRATDAFAAFSKDDLREYPKFIAVIREFRRFYGLEAFSLKEVDVFLWIVGKEFFKRSYY